MLSTIGVHQPQQTPGIRSTINSTNYNPHQQQYNTIALNGIPQPDRRLLNLQYLDLTDCTSLEDSGLKMIVECCPQLLYLFLRRCTTISGKKNENTKVFEKNCDLPISITIFKYI